MNKLRRRLAASAIVASASIGALGIAAVPASAHEGHKYNYVFGSTAACPGTADVSAYRYNDFGGSAHKAITEVSLVRGNHCLRASTSTWSDDFWTGFRHWVSFT